MRLLPITHLRYSALIQQSLFLQVSRYLQFFKTFIMTTEMGDVIAIRIRLNELKTQFDNAMRDGENFAALKKIYMEIKELECHLKVIDWSADNKVRIYGRNYSQLNKPSP